jgi:hypothetical protein
MKSLYSLILCALCASAFSLTADQVAGSWVVDVEATAPLREAAIRKQVPPVTDAKQIAAEMETWRKETSTRVVEFTAQTVTVFKNQDGAKTKVLELKVTLGKPDQKALVLTCDDDTKVTLTPHGDGLEMKNQKGKMDPTIWILKRPAAAAPMKP